MDEIDNRIDACRARWEVAPRSRAFIALADALRQGGRYDEALTVLGEGLAVHPGAVGGLVTLARTQLAAGWGEAAADTAVRVLEHDPDNVVALELLADAEEQSGELAAAIAHCERLAQLVPGDPHWATRLAALRDAWCGVPGEDGGDGAASGFATQTLVDLCLAQGYRDKAARLLRRLAAERPGDPLVAARLAAVGLDPDADEPEPAVASAAGGPERTLAAMAGIATGSARREAAREQFTRWLDRIRAERELPQ